MSIMDLSKVDVVIEGRTILRDISWQVESGQHWALVGNNGSGKSTLLNLACGYRWPSSGHVSVIGQSFGEVDLREMRKSIGYVAAHLRDRFPQSRPHERVLDVVLSGLFASVGIFDEVSLAHTDRARQMLAWLGCGQLQDRLFRDLSEGERQRVLLARAFMAQPQLLLLDEPCSGLDVAARELLLEGLQQLLFQNAKTTLVYVTHHIEELVPEISHVMLLRQGEVVASGAKRQVLTSTLVSRCLGVPATVQWQEERPWIKISRSVRAGLPGTR